MTNEAHTRQIAEGVQQYMRDHQRATSDEAVAEDSNACGGFVDGCDDYNAFAFSAYIDGRQFYITVEDVTIAEGR